MSTVPSTDITCKIPGRRRLHLTFQFTAPGTSWGKLGDKLRDKMLGDKIMNFVNSLAKIGRMV